MVTTKSPGTNTDHVMGKKIKEVTQYINDSADFAKPILKRLRKLCHEASPKLDEAIKWGCPYFEYNGLVVGMARFKNHVSFGFWKSKEMKDPNNLFTRGAKASMCNVQVKSLEEMPSDSVLRKYIRAAVKLNEPATVAKKSKSPKKAAGKKAVGKKAAVKKPVPKVPAPLARALNKKKKARDFFESLSPSGKRDYCEWIAEAKRDSTKEKRIATAIEWLSEGKSRHWKYR